MSELISLQKVSNISSALTLAKEIQNYMKVKETLSKSNRKCFIVSFETSAPDYDSIKAKVDANATCNLLDLMIAEKKLDLQSLGYSL